MYYVYVLKSLKDKKLYYGSTNDLKRRFLDHNKGMVESTKRRTPFKLVYYEAFLSEQDCREREQKLKNYGKVTTELSKRIKLSLLMI